MVCFFLSIFVLLTAYLILLPLAKKRPIFLRELGAATLVFFLLATLAVFLHPLIYIVTITLSLWVFIVRVWIILGVPGEKVADALGRALIATRTKYKQLNNHYEIDNSVRIKIVNVSSKMCLVVFKSRALSQKANLTKGVFRKFVQNYHLEL